MPTDEPLPLPSPDENDPLKHQGLVGWVARYYLDRGLDLDDLKQEGEFGLLKACERFDPGRGLKFTTYAPYWIKESIKAALDDQARPIRVPVYLWRLVRQGVRPDSPGLTVEQRANLRAALVVILGECSGTVELVLARCDVNAEAVSTSDQVADLADDYAAVVAPHLAALTPRERAVMVHTFGLDGSPPMLPHEIATTLGISRQRINQLYGVAISKLRAALQGTDR